MTQQKEPTKLELLVELGKVVIDFKKTIERVTAGLENMLKEDQWQPSLPYPENS